MRAGHATTMGKIPAMLSTETSTDDPWEMGIFIPQFHSPSMDMAEKL